MAENGKTKPIRQNIPTELSGVSSETTDRLEERLDKCYSEEDYHKFQDHVRTIVVETIKSEDGVTEIKKQSVRAMKEHTMDKWFENRTFWIPLIVSVAVTVLGLVGEYFIFAKMIVNK